MISDVIIRKGKLEDARQYISLQDSVFRFAHKDVFPPEVFHEREMDKQKRIEEFSKDIYNDKKRMTYVAEDQDAEELIGLISGDLISNNDYYKQLGYAELTDIYIKLTYQRFKFGTKLKNIFVDWLKQNGATKFVIKVLEDNTRARRVFEKWGGVLDEHSESIVVLDVEFKEVFYIFDL